jgi:multidrug efflux system membrane fusion protein
MKVSRIIAIGLIAAAALWIGSGYMASDDKPKNSAASRATDTSAQKPFRVAVIETRQVLHSRKLVLSGRTEAHRKMMVVARTNGIITKLNVRRGSQVRAGDIIAVLSDEAREAQVAQARALVNQRKDELEAKRRLITTGALPRLDLGNLEAQFKAAEAALVSAEAELERSSVTAAWSGVVTDVPIEPGQAVSINKEIAQLVALDPMLVVVEVSERRLSGVIVGARADIRLINGATATGRIRYVSKSASSATRTYRVEVEVPNPNGDIPDGITAEVVFSLAPQPATRVPRSALTFSSAGDLGVRAVDQQSRVVFIPVALAEDEQHFMWVTGIAGGAGVIVQGQDFVREGQLVEAVAVTAATVRR